MTLLAVVAYPRWADDDRARIEEFRSRHDPQASRISAHVMLVFPLDVDLDVLVDHVRTTLAPCRPFVTRFASVEAVEDPLTGRHLVFWLPDVGDPDVRDLHDRLYTGPLRAHLRADLPYRPHVTLASVPQADACRRLADELSARRRHVEAVVDAVEIVAVESEQVTTRSIVRLSAPNES